MTSAEIEVIVRRIVSLQNQEQAMYFGLMVCVVVTIAAIAAFLGGYFKGRGELAARQTDLKKILNELEETTKAVQKVKQEIEFGDWKRREELRTKREKLEELLFSAYELDEYLDDHRAYHAFNGLDPHESRTIGRIKSLQSLYFPSLESDVSTLTNCASAAQVTHFDIAQERMDRASKTVGVKWQDVLPNKDLLESAMNSRKSYLQALNGLRGKSAGLMNSFLTYERDEQRSEPEQRNLDQY